MPHRKYPARVRYGSRIESGMTNSIEKEANFTEQMTIFLIHHSRESENLIGTDLEIGINLSQLRSLALSHSNFRIYLEKSLASPILPTKSFILLLLGSFDAE